MRHDTPVKYCPTSVSGGLNTIRNVNEMFWSYCLHRICIFIVLLWIYSSWLVNFLNVLLSQSLHFIHVILYVCTCGCTVYQAGYVTMVSPSATVHLFHSTSVQHEFLKVDMLEQQLFFPKQITLCKSCCSHNPHIWAVCWEALLVKGHRRGLFSVQ